MSELQTLEEITETLGLIFHESSPIILPGIDVAGLSAAQTASELERLEAERRHVHEYFTGRKESLSAYINNISGVPVQDAAKYVAATLSEIREAVGRLKGLEQQAKEVGGAYQEKLLNEAGFTERNELDNAISSLRAERWRLRKERFGKFRHRAIIRELDGKISSLNGLDARLRGPSSIPLRPTSEYKYDYQEYQEKGFSAIAGRLFDGYESLAEQQKGIQPEPRPLPQAVLDSLGDQYLERYVSDEIEEALQENLLRQDQYGKENVQILSDGKLVEHALAIAKEGLSTPRAMTWNKEYSPEEEMRIKGLSHGIEDLPYVLRQIVGSAIMASEISLDDEFREFAEYAAIVPAEKARRDLVASFSGIRKRIEDLAAKAGIDYFILAEPWFHEGIYHNLERTLSTTGLQKFVYEASMPKWDLFKSNALVKDLYGEEALHDLDKAMRDEVFKNLLITHEHTEESNTLGHKTIWFKDPLAVAYNIMNFWRESGFSGERPFLSIHSSSENTIAAKYVSSLTEEELAGVGRLNAPGLADIIRLLRDHPDTFRKPHLGSWDDEKPNPVYNDVQKALGRLTNHFLEKGTQEERYFALGSALANTGNIELGLGTDRESDRLVELISEEMGLGEHASGNFKAHQGYFFRHLEDHLRGSRDIKAAKETMLAVSDYYDGLADLMSSCAHPEAVKEEAGETENDYNHIRNATEDLPKLLAYLAGYDTDVVQEILSREDHKEQIESRLRKTKENVFSAKMTLPDEIAKALPRDLSALVGFIDESERIIGDSPVSDILRQEQERILQSIIYSEQISEETKSLSLYFKALDNRRIAKRFVAKDDAEKYQLQKLARVAYDTAEDLAVPLVRGALRHHLDFDRLRGLQEYLPKLNPYGRVLQALSAKADQKGVFTMVKSLASMGEDSLHLASAIEQGEMSFDSARATMLLLEKKGFAPTSYLVKSLISADDKEKTLDRWLDMKASFDAGMFDAKDELHRNLEYARFRSIVDHEKVRKHLKNHFTFDDYLSIFEKEEGEKVSFQDIDRFEIASVAEEARRFKGYILQVKQTADALGRKVYVVPNLSYGYLPVAPLVNELAKEGIETILGIKVGSTQSHNNKEVLNSRLFSGYRAMIAEDEPILIIADGTQHLIAREGEDKEARYPDAYQGYLNQMIALNDAMGFTDIDYSGTGKSEEDMAKLRGSSEFQRLVGIYKDAADKKEPAEKEPYTFGFWNMAGLDLIIRNYHKKIMAKEALQTKDILGPAIVFCNVGMLDEQLPEELKRQYPGIKHFPAYFDDSKKIIDFDFGYDSSGIKYLNTLETEVKKAYGSSTGQVQSIDDISALVRYAKEQALLPQGSEY